MMGRWGREISLVAAIALTLLSAVGCGGGSSSTDATASSAGKPPLGAKASKAAAKLGRPASPSELAAVSALVKSSVRARADRDWAGQCATLSSQVKAFIGGSRAVRKLSVCAAQLSVQGKGVPDSLLADNMAGGVAEFRVKGREGSALYHGSDGKDWRMPMVREDGEWKVGALLAGAMRSS